MSTLAISVVTQSLTFIPLALGIAISYIFLRAADMTLDGSFVLGAGLFAKLVTSGFPPIFAAILSLLAGGLAGVTVSLIQRGGKVDPLLAGILASFILTSSNLILMGKPNINLLAQTTLVSQAFLQSEAFGWTLVAVYSALICILALLIINSRLGLSLRALGDNPNLLRRMGKNIETYRMLGFALTNTLAAAAGCLTAQTVGYADIGMGFGMTLTGIGAIILGLQIVKMITRQTQLRVKGEFFACLCGVLLYFFAINGLLRLDINPIYLKLVLGIILIIFLRAAINPSTTSNAS